MDFDLTADQKLFRATTREFLEKEMPLTRVRELASSGIGFEADWWKRGSELGWNSMIVDPAAGGDSISGEGLVGTCIVGAPNGPSIVNVPCSRTHDARVDTNMSTQAAYCPSGDELFVPQPPDPSLCLNFRDHNP